MYMYYSLLFHTLWTPLKLALRTSTHSIAQSRTSPRTILGEAGRVATLLYSTDAPAVLISLTRLRLRIGS